MKRIAVWIGNGAIGIASDEDLEVAFMDRDGEYVEVIPANPELLQTRFDECLKETDNV